MKVVVVAFLFIASHLSCESCTVAHFYHIPKTGGSLLRRAFDGAVTRRHSSEKQQHPHPHPNPGRTATLGEVYVFDFWRHKELEVGVLEYSAVQSLAMAARISYDISRLAPNDTLFIHQHTWSPGLVDTTETLIPIWRSQAGSKGCRYISLTLVREPLALASGTYTYHGFGQGEDVAAEVRSAGLLLDNPITRCVLNNNPANPYQRVTTPYRGMRKEDADIALAALGRLDVIADLRCEERLTEWLSAATGVPLVPQHADANARGAYFSPRKGLVDVLTAAGLIEWDKYIYERVQQLDTFMTC